MRWTPRGVHLNHNLRAAALPKGPRFVARVAYLSIGLIFDP